MKYQQIIDDFVGTFILNFNLIIGENNRYNPDAEAFTFLEQNDRLLHSSLTAFYKEAGYYGLLWENSLGLDADMAGAVKIIKVSKALSDWKDIVYFEPDSELRHFKILDQFSNEGCCGYFTTESTEYPHHIIYYYDFHDEVKSLHLDITGYIRMLVTAKGFFNWQRALLDHLSNIVSPHTRLMMESLHLVFEDFDFEKFIAAYEEVKR